MTAELLGREGGSEENTDIYTKQTPSGSGFSRFTWDTSEPKAQPGKPKDDAKRGKRETGLSQVFSQCHIFSLLGKVIGKALRGSSGAEKHGALFDAIFQRGGQHDLGGTHFFKKCDVTLLGAHFA